MTDLGAFIQQLTEISSSLDDQQKAMLPLAIERSLSFATNQATLANSLHRYFEFYAHDKANPDEPDQTLVVQADAMEQLRALSKRSLVLSRDISSMDMPGTISEWSRCALAILPGDLTTDDLNHWNTLLFESTLKAPNKDLQSLLENLKNPLKDADATLVVTRYEQPNQRAAFDARRIELHIDGKQVFNVMPYEEATRLSDTKRLDKARERLGLDKVPPWQLAVSLCAYAEGGWEQILDAFLVDMVIGFA